MQHPSTFSSLTPKIKKIVPEKKLLYFLKEFHPKKPLIF